MHAVRPTQGTSISSPYAGRGVLWETYRRHHGPEGDPAILVAQGTSRDFNPELPQSVVDRALERDPLANRAEYLAEFRTDVESLLTQEAVQACIDPGVKERPPEHKHVYTAFVDPSGGSSDSMTLAIAHKEGETEILDLIRERRAPFSPEAVVASTMLRYRCHTCYGDRYAGEWPVEQFSKAGVHLEPAEKIKSDIYLDLLPLINSKAVRLLDHERMMLQLVGLERSTKSGGRDKIDHPRGLHDDVANAAAGALVFAYQGISYSPGQRLRDDLKLQEGYRRLARSLA